jgi:hypothetical protein
MSRAVKLLVAIALAAALPWAAARAAEPEAAYASFHRAAASGNQDEMLRYVPDAQRAETNRLSAAQKDAALKMQTAMMPRAFLLRDKLLSEDARSARLVVSGPGESAGGGPPATLYGVIRMVVERGEWRVLEARWSGEQPAFLGPMLGMPVRPAATGARGTAPAAAAPGAAKAPPTAAAPLVAAPIVGSTTGTPLRKLGTAKPPCEFKPVMTAEDLENCR